MDAGGRAMHGAIAERGIRIKLSIPYSLNLFKNKRNDEEENYLTPLTQPPTPNPLPAWGEGLRTKSYILNYAV